MGLIAYGRVQVGFEPCTLKIGDNRFTTKTIIAWILYILFSYSVFHRKETYKIMRTKPWFCPSHKQNFVHKNHCSKPMVLCMKRIINTLVGLVYRGGSICDMIIIIINTTFFLFLLSFVFSQVYHFS